MVTKCIMSKCVFSIDRIAVSGGSASSQCTSTCSFGGEFVQLVGLQVAQMYNSHANRLRARKVRISAGRFVDTHTHTHTHTHTLLGTRRSLLVAGVSVLSFVRSCSS